MKRAIMRLLDWLDEHVLRHRWYRVCFWIGLHPWWDKEGKR